MTEDDWLVSTAPTPMVEFLRSTGKAGDRRLLLFGAACCRRLLAFFPNGAIRRAAECGERHADGQAAPGERSEAEKALAPQPGPRRGLPRALTATQAAIGQGTWMGTEDAPWPVPPDRRGAEEWALRAARLLVAACGVRQVRQVRLVPRVAGHALGAMWLAANDRYQVLRCPGGEEVRVARATWEAAEAARTAEQTAQAALLRDIFANPFRPPAALASALLTLDVPALARGAYEDRLLPSGRLDPGRLAALADAVEAAGCTDEELLEHLRGDGPHCRGCWPVDLLLGRH
jgi:hypothetical protein